MAFKATVVVTQDAFANIRRQAASTRAYMLGRKTALQQATCDAAQVLSMIQHCGTVLDLLAGWAATPGLAEYAKAQVNDPTYDVGAEYVVMRDALVALRANIMAMFPKDAGGFLLYQTFRADGQLQSRTFTAAQVSAVLPLVDAVIAAIE